MASNHCRGGSAPEGEEKEGSSGMSVSKLSAVENQSSTDASSQNGGAPSSTESFGLTSAIDEDAQTRMFVSSINTEKGTIKLQKGEELGDTTTTTSDNKVSIPKHRLIPISKKSKHRLIPTATTTTKPKQQSSPSSRRQLPLGWTSKQESPPDHNDKKRTSSTSPSIMQMQNESTELKLLPDKDKLKSFQRRKSSVVPSQQKQQQQSKASSSVPSQKQKQSEKRNNQHPKEASTKFALSTKQQKSLAEQRRRVARNQTPITLIEVTMNEKEKNESKCLLTCFLSRMDNNEKCSDGRGDASGSGRKRGAYYNDTTTTTSSYVDRYQHNSNNYGAPYHYTAVSLHKKARDNE